MDAKLHRLKHRKCECRSTSCFKVSMPICIILLFYSVVTIPWPTHETEELSYARRRTTLYETMAADLEKNGAKFLEGGPTSQSLAVSDIFLFKNERLQPILKPADPSVRATVLYLDPSFAISISNTVKQILSPCFPTGKAILDVFEAQKVVLENRRNSGKYILSFLDNYYNAPKIKISLEFSGIWYQDPKLYHFSMFHASHHLEPVLATPFEIVTESHNVEIVASRCCKLWIVLEKVVLTSTGVLLGCWQVSNGTDPAIIRRELKRSLPNAPSKQLYDEVMLHTSFARVVKPSNKTSKGPVREAFLLLQKLVAELDRELHNYQAQVTEMWFVEELDVLALALNGHIKPHKFPLKCHSS